MWFGERVISALNRTWPLEVVTMTGIVRGKEEISTVVIKTRGSESIPGPEFESKVESMSREVTTEPM